MEGRLEAGKAELAGLRKSAAAQATAGAKVKTLRDTAQSGLEVLQARRADVLEAASMAQVRQHLHAALATEGRSMLGKLGPGLHACLDRAPALDCVHKLCAADVGRRIDHGSFSLVLLLKHLVA